MHRTKVDLVVGHVENDESWNESFEIDHEENTLASILEAAREVISKFNETETLRYEEKAKLRRLISCTIAKKEEKMSVKDFVDKARKVMAEAADDLKREEYMDFLSEVQTDAENRAEALEDEEEDEDDTEEDEE